LRKASEWGLFYCTFVSMKFCPFIAVIILSFFAGCKQHEQLEAKIFERKRLEGNRILIRYEYRLNNKLYTDSATMANVVMNTDSIRVIIDPANPGKSIPDIEK
jgi:hypothetical protein